MRHSFSAGCLLLLASSCGTPHLAVLPHGGNLEPEGDIAASGSMGTLGFSGSNSLEALGFQEDEGVPGVRVDVSSGATHWTFAYQQSEHGGTGTLEAEISDEDVVIPAGSQVDTIFDMGLGEVLLTFDVIPSDTVELGLGLGATVLDLDLAVTDSVTGETFDPDKEVFPVPLLALRVGVQFWRIDLQALLGGIDVTYEGDRVALYDFDAFARLSLFGEAERAHGALIVGYRYLDLDVDYDNDDGTESVAADITFDGPYIGLSLGL